MIIKYLVYTDTIIMFDFFQYVYFTSFSLKTNNANVSFIHLFKIQHIIYTADLDFVLEANHNKLLFFVPFIMLKKKEKLTTI